MKKYFPAIIFIFIAALIQIVPVFAVTTSTFDTSSLPLLGPNFLSGTDGQLLRLNNGRIDVVPNSFATSSNSLWNINLGAYANYPNPSGMFNTYNESPTGDPILGASFMGSTTNYVQGIFIQNLAKGGNASADVVIANDKGTATSTDNYMDLGVANTNQVDSAHTNIMPYDGYLYNQGTSTIPGIILSPARNSVILSAGMQSTSPSFRIDKSAHIFTKGSAPTLSGCGTNPTVRGNDNSGEVSLGTGLSVTACTVTFATAWPATPVCNVSSGSTLAAASISSISTTAFSAGLTLSLGGGKLYYQCQGIDS